MIKKITLSALAILLFLCVLFFLMWRKTEGERDRLQKNQNTLLEKVDYYKTEAGRNAASVAALTLSKREIQEYNKDLVRTCDELNISLRRMISASTTGIASNYRLSGFMRDSVIIHDTIDTAKCFDYSDPHLSFSCCVDSSSYLVADIETRDTIKSILHRVPRKFLFIKFGTKSIRQEILSTNPSTHIICTELIENKRKKR